MAPTVGIPRGLLYYKYGPMWRAFFERLGYTVLVSPPTNKAVLEAGTRLGENELCLPVKLLFGHVAALDGTADCIFVPRIVSVDRREYTCPKCLGLPDLTRALGFHSAILGPTFNLRLGRIRLLKDAYAFGRTLCADRLRVVVAMAAAVRANREHARRLVSGELLRLPDAGIAAGPRLRIGVAGHAYNIYDSVISQDLLRRLAARGVDVVTADMVGQRDIERAVSGLPKALFWTYEKELVGAVRHWARLGSVDGIVHVLSFACGPDSFITLLLEDSVRELAPEGGIPFMALVIDEHTAEAGIVTRVEAFIDMLSRRVQPA